MKQNLSGDRGVGMRGLPGGRLNVTNATVKMLITFAYRLRDFQVIGGPDWTNSDRWDIQAKAEEGSVPANIGLSDPSISDPAQLMC